jgi:tetratricopeptide (TPR) repeat protein
VEQNNRGCVLAALKRYKEAITSHNKALEINPDEAANTFCGKAECYALQNQADLAIESLQQAVAIDPKYRDEAKTNTDFDSRERSVSGIAGGRRSKP